MSSLCLLLSFVKACQWPCLSPCAQLCHRWSITTGGSLLQAEPCGPANPDKSAINASPQSNALIGLDRHSGPYASFMPPRPQKPGVGRYVHVHVCVVSLLHYSAPAVWGLCHWFLLPCFIGPEYTVSQSAVSVCLSACIQVHVLMWKCHIAL